MCYLIRYGTNNFIIDIQNLIVIPILYSRIFIIISTVELIALLYSFTIDK